MQLLDSRREKKQQGDDDIIYTGNGGGASTAANIGGSKSTVYAGDGDDIINQGKAWLDSAIYAGRGDDTVNVLNGFNIPGVTIPSNLSIFGGEGEDLIQTSAEEQDSLSFSNVVIAGQEDNDRIGGFDNVSGSLLLSGGSGNDKIDMGEGHSLTGSTNVL